jgi:hypothetical protein
MKTRVIAEIFAKRPYQTNKIGTLPNLQAAYQQIAPDKPGASTRTQVNDLSMTCQPLQKTLTVKENINGNTPVVRITLCISNALPAAFASLRKLTSAYNKLTSSLHTLHHLTFLEVLK